MPMRLLIVSNRLPVTVLDEQTLKLRESVGGLSSGLGAYIDSAKTAQDFDYIWVGWPGRTVKRQMREKLKSALLSGFKAYPIFLSETAMEKFYHGFCNRTIWPLFHYFPSLAVYDEDYWTTYVQVNEEFCNEILKILEPGDVVWVHDYHLMLLPRMLRDKAPNNAIGFFLHIPFPSYEIFRLLPSRWRKAILEGLLGADLIGFHTHDYTQYFARCVLRILGYEPSMGRIRVNGRLSKADTFPMGIDFDKFHSAAESPDATKEIERIRKTLFARKIVLSIDRLDYTKGILNRLRGYEAFLERSPSWQGKVTLVAVVVPSRVKVEHYQLMKRRIDELVGKINGKFGNVNWTPILYSYKYIPFEQLIAFYRTCDVALITPLRDGMNLIAKEFIATKTDGKGVLILSEMAGAAKAMDEALIINPNNVEEIADALREALEMPEDEQIRRNKTMIERIKRYDVIRWADDFIDTLLEAKKDQERLNIMMLGPSAREDLEKNYRHAKKRLLFLDYDGTLVPFSNDPQSTIPGDELLSILRILSGNPRNEVILISGREKSVLQRWFGKLDLSLVAEHGAWIKRKSEDWRISKPLSASWKPLVMPVMKRYADRLPGSFVEEKEYSLVWHYRAADQEAAAVKVREIMDDLVSFTANIDVHVLRGNKIVEVRSAGVNKGLALIPWISKADSEFILAVGDDSTDEEMFRVLPDSAYSLKVGTSESCARFRLEGPADVLRLLEELKDADGQSTRKVPALQS
ncbi:MAG: Bifunctional trehalose-6-phosphate synthase/phosphatase [Methanosaeta sp. PtaU1.Bin060]|nr:MAG: Bifunctional trehalose-6-phosphate synthase/phosphatase [Methanosaeta sp. PtaU1.Bin060]